MFDLVEESLDEISLAVKGKVAQALDDPVSLGRNHRAGAAFSYQPDNGVGVIAFVGQYILCGDAPQQQLRLRAVGDIAGRENDADRIAQRVTQGMYFGRQSAARAANVLRLLTPPFAPALC